MRTVLLAVLTAIVISIAAPATAQGAITKYSLLVIAPGANPATAAPVQTTDYLVSVPVCNQLAPAVPATVVNPTQFFFDDVFNTGKVCIVSLSAATLTALPNAPGYVVVLVSADDLGQVSPRSAASNSFTRQGLPATPTGVKIK